MDDLLSAAISESGLDEFFTNDCFFQDAEEQPSPTVTSDTSEIETSPGGGEYLEPQTIPSKSVSPINIAIPETVPIKQSQPSSSNVLISPTVNAAHNGNQTRPTNGTQFVQRQPLSVETTIRTKVPPGGFSTHSLLRRVIQTPNGPQTQLLKPYTDENGKTVYRQVRTISNAQVARAANGTPRRGNGSRVVVIKQDTPNGPKYVRQVLPPGAQIQSTITPRGTIIRRIITRGGGTHANSKTYAAQPSQSSIVSPRLPSTEHQYYPRQAQQIATTTRVVRGAPAIRRAQPQPFFRTTRTSQVYDRPSSRQESILHSRPGSSAEYSPVPSPTFSRRTPLSGYSASSPALSNMGTFDYSNMPFITSRGSENYSGQMSPGIKKYPMTIDSKNRRASQMSLPRSLSGLGIPFDDKAVLKIKDDKHSPGSSSKSMKAKEEMKEAMQTAKDRRLDDDEEENLGYAETYSDYRPAKLRSGLAHPDSVVETASLSSVAPPDVVYQCTMPEDLIDTGAVSALQLEAVIYACQAHDKRLPTGERCGYLIGDGAGVGKGRTVACIIFENYLLGRKRSIWLSVSSDLRFDSERDLRDIGASRIKVFPLNKLKYAKISGQENGFIKKGCVFATYSSLIGECRTASKKYRSRLNQLVQWFGVEYDGVIIFDECHRAKNLVPGTGGKPTKTGRVVLELQKKLPNARIVYASATGATEPRNMAYMTRLGLWGQGQAFSQFSEFINAVERRGVGAMEIVAMDMKQRGLYLARQLSFRGVSFRVEEIALSEEFIKVYDESVKLWMECRRQFQAVLSTMSDAERSSSKQTWGQFWASHQRFFKYLCIGAKVDACVRMTREAIKANKCIVIGLQSTGESRTNEMLEESGGELNEFVSTAKAVLLSLIEKHFPTERGNCVDVFRDFDRMYDDFDRPKKRKAPGNPYGFDVLEELGLGLPSKLQPKRTRTSNEVSDDDDSDEDDDDEDDDEEVSDETDSETEIKLGDNEDDWINKLLAEAASSSESDNDDDDDDSGKSGSDNEKEKNGSDGGADDDEFNPFFCDFSKGDPYVQRARAGKEPKKKRKREKTEEEIHEERRQKRIRRKKKKRKILKQQQKMERKKQKRELQTQAMQSTANEFISSSRIIDGFDINPQIIKAELLAAVERLGPQLPANTLDQLIDELGGPEYVAEMTGRKGRIVTRADGEIEYELRSAGADVPLELMNMDEKDKFMKGEKLCAVISEAASSGISLQSDRRAKNQRRRVHITLELPWSADKAIQQFGRTHRSNQVSAPEYVFLISELAGEKRFASIVAKRLESLGALTHGDRRATESRDLSQFNLDTKYGRAALDVLLKSVIGVLSPPLIAPPADYKPGDFFSDMRLYMEGVGLLSRMDNGQYMIEREGAMIAKFLNRILGLPVHAQNALFQYFTEIVNELIAQAKHDGTYDMGIMDLGTGGDQVRKLETRIFLGRAEKGSFRVEINKIGVERGIPWEDAYAIYMQHNVGEDGFYVSSPPHSISKVVALVYGIGKKRLDTGDRLYALTRPATGRSPKMETFSELVKRFKKVTPEEAESIWKLQYASTFSYAISLKNHLSALRRCANIDMFMDDVAMRTVIILSVWPVVERVLNDDSKVSRIQVIRVRTDSDQKIVGLLVLPQFVRHLVLKLEEHCGRSFIENKKEPPTPSPPPSSSATPQQATPQLMMKKEEILGSLD